MFDQDPLTVEQKQHLGRIAAKCFLDITDQWQLSDNQRRILVGAATRTTISTWRVRVKERKVLQLSHDTYERIQCILSIQAALAKHTGITSIRKPIDQFEGATLLEVMMQGNVMNLYEVWLFLEHGSRLNLPGEKLSFSGSDALPA